MKLLLSFEFTAYQRNQIGLIVIFHFNLEDLFNHALVITLSDIDLCIY